MSILDKLLHRTHCLEKACRCGRPSQVRVTSTVELESPAVRVCCLTCLESLLKPVLAARSGGCVVVQPYRDAPCLVPYVEGQSSALAAWPARVNQLLSRTGRRCILCGTPTPGLVWLKTDAGQTLQAMCGNPRWLADRQGTTLCAGCLTSALVRTIAERSLLVEELVLPADGVGAWLPWRPGARSRTEALDAQTAATFALSSRVSPSPGSFGRDHAGKLILGDLSADRETGAGHYLPDTWTMHASSRK
jgi:hypothetical protein